MRTEKTRVDWTEWAKSHSKGRVDYPADYDGPTEAEESCVVSYTVPKTPGIGPRQWRKGDFDGPRLDD